MASISLRDVGITATFPLFQNLSFTLGDGDCLGLVAQNGGGKTSLLRCLAGTAEPTTGEIVRSRGLRVGFVEQDVPDNLRPLTLYEAVRRALPPEQRDDESWRVDVILDEFTAPADMRDRPVAALSGGWQRLMLIARVWVTEPDALLLDEPTNHLDLEKLYQLETWLKGVARSVPVIVASHDRDFLDAVTNRTLFLRPAISRYFALPYGKARIALDAEDEAAAGAREKSVKEANRLRRNAGELKNIGINSGSDLLQRKAKFLRERAETIEDNLKSVHREKTGDIRLGNSGTHAKVLLALQDVTVRRPDSEPLFRIPKLHLFQGDRLVLLGRNGAGKSQLVKLLRRAIDDPDSVPGIKFSPSLILGYMDQDLSQLPPAARPADLISRFHLGDQRSTSLLAGAGFAVEKQDRAIAQLSFGQRARLALLMLRLAEPNFYLLDEPTNHIDIAGQEALQAEILAHEATVMLVSHDRRFVRELGTRFLVIEGNRLKEVDAPDAFFAEMAATADR
jgi:ATPase subunit of ABC transporter with duplicated ATPase domains